MTEDLILFIDRLEEGQEELINHTLAGSFLGIHEEEIQTPHPVMIKGKASCICSFLMLSLEVSTVIVMPCSICNALTTVCLSNQDISYSLPLSDLPSSQFDYTELVREEIVMMIPQFTHCSQGNCPKREGINQYCKKNVPSSQNFPFAQL
ncbi:MAG: hypothetical protein QRY72_00500 [Candidatus Rhabdochlamydia sp.]